MPAENPFNLSAEQIAEGERQTALHKASIKVALTKSMGPRDAWGKLINPDAKPKRQKNNNPEGQVQSASMTWLALNKIFHFRVNNLPVPLPNGGYRPVHMRGIPDVICIIKGAFIGLEFKSDVGRQSPDQKVFEERCRSSGGHYFLVRSVDDVIEYLKPLL